MEFLDTNVLVYAASQQAADQQKADVARALLRRGPHEFAISLQVLQEFYVAARAPRKLALSQEDLNDGQDYDSVRVENPFRGIAHTP